MNERYTPGNTIDLPANYRYFKNVDYNNDKKLLASLQISVLLVIGLMIGIAVLFDLPMKSHWSIWVSLPATLGMVGIYLVIHELIHGTAAYLISGVKPTYGVKLPYFCTGCPAYFNKASFIVVALAPVVIWTIFLVAMLLVLPPDFFKSIYIVLAVNLAGSSGDIFLAFVVSKQPSSALFQDKSGTEPKIFLPSA